MPPLEFVCKLTLFQQSLPSSVKSEALLTVDAALKAHKYSNWRQQQHLCVYKTARSPVGVSLHHWNMKHDRR